MVAISIFRGCSLDAWCSADVAPSVRTREAICARNSKRTQRLWLCLPQGWDWGSGSRSSLSQLEVRPPHGKHPTRPDTRCRSLSIVLHPLSRPRTPPIRWSSSLETPIAIRLRPFRPIHSSGARVRRLQPTIPPPATRRTPPNRPRLPRGHLARNHLEHEGSHAPSASSISRLHRPMLPQPNRRSHPRRPRLRSACHVKTTRQIPRRTNLPPNPRIPRRPPTIEDGPPGTDGSHLLHLLPRLLLTNRPSLPGRSIPSSDRR